MAEESANENEFLSLQELGLDGTLFINDPRQLADELLAIMDQAKSDLSNDESSKELVKSFYEEAEKNEVAKEAAKSILKSMIDSANDTPVETIANLYGLINEFKSYLDSIVWAKVVGDNLKVPRAQIHYLHKSAREQYKMLHKFNAARSKVLGLPEVTLPEVPKGLSGNFRDKGNLFFVIDGVWELNPYTVRRKLGIEEEMTLAELIELFETGEYGDFKLELKEMR